MPAPRRIAGRDVRRLSPSAAAASAPNQTRRLARPRPPAPAQARPADAPDTRAVELAGLLHELSERLLSAADLAEALNRLAAFTAAAAPGAVRCSVALITDGEALTLAASGSGGQAVDECQYETGQGPGLDAARSRTMVTTQDLAADPRWPALAGCARTDAVHSVASVPLDVRRSSVGALSVFVAQPRGIGPDLLITLMAVVGQAEVLLGELGRREALSQGATVDRAIGVIIAQRGCGVREAYDVLEETSQRLGLDRESVAGRLIAAAARVRE